MSQETIGAKRELLPSRSGFFIEFLAGDERGRKVPLVYAKTILGRKNGDILVRDIRVSANHLAIEFKYGRVRVIDLGSSNGTFIHRKKISQTDIDLGQEIQIGQTVFAVRQNKAIAEKLLGSKHSHMKIQSGGLTGLLDREFVHTNKGTEVSIPAKPAKPEDRVVKVKILSGTEAGKEFNVKKTRVSIGRVNCDIQIKDRDVSRKHVMLEIEEGGQVILRDLASSNGTYVNQIKVSDCVIQPGDRIQIGKTIILFESARPE